VVAASAVKGHIASPVSIGPERARIEVRRAGDGSPRRASSVELLPGFPERITGRALFLPRDNLNTDGIFAGKWTYKDDMTAEEMARVVFENYDERFDEIYRSGDIIVSGRNFGTGSSREQAATALAHRGIPCVVAASFSQTYKRNAFNNGFPVLECPGLVDHLAETLEGSDHPTRPGPEITIDFPESVVRAGDRSFPFPPLGRVPQELIVAGGAEALVRRRLDEAPE
jgi:homoaconitate hydratase